MSEATSVGQIGLDLVINQGRFNKQLSGLTKIAKKAGAALAAAFGVKQLVSFSKQCIELGSDLQEVQNVVDTTFTSMSSKVDKFAKDSMKNFGLSETMSKKYTGTLGAMAKAFGFSEKQAYDMSTTLTGLAGDIASFYNISQDEAFTKLKSVFTGETESLKELGVVMTQSALDQYALANGFGKTTKSMTEAEKVALRYAFVQNQLSTAAGDFARTSGGWANQMRVLNLQFESLKAAIGQGLINALTPALRAINSLMSGLVNLANAFKNFTGLFVKSNKAADGAKRIANNYTAAAESSKVLGAAGTNAMNKVGKAAEKASKKVRTLMGFDQINKVSENEGSSSGSGSPSTTGGSGGTTVGVEVGVDEEKVSSLPKAYEKLAASIERFKTACSGLSTVVSGGLKWGYENILKPLGNWTLNKLAPGILDVFSGAIRVLTEALKALSPLGTWLWDKFLKPVAGFAGDVIIKFLVMFAEGLDRVSNWISEHQGAVQNIAIALGSVFVALKGASIISKAVGLFSKISGVISFLGGPLKIITTLFTNLPFFISCIVPAITPAIAGFAGLVAAGVLLWKNWDKIKKKGKQFFKSFNDLCKKLEKKVDGFVETVKEIPKQIKEFFSEKIEGVEEWFSGIKEGFTNTLSNLADAIPDMEEIKEAISEKIGEVKAKVSGKMEDAKDWWTNLKTGISDKIGEIKKKVSAVKDEAFDKVKGAWDAIKNGEAAKTVKALKEKGFDKVKKAFDAVKSKTATLKASLKNKAGKTLDSLKKKWDGFKSKTATLTAKFKDVFTEPLKKVWNGIAGKINGAIEMINKIPGVNITGRVPKLAKGGYVAKNTPQLAMIGDNRHQGEVVSPEKKLEEMALKAAQMASGSGNAEIISLLRQLLAAILALNLTVNLDGKDIMNNTVKRINEITLATGRSPIIT